MQVGRKIERRSQSYSKDTEKSPLSSKAKSCRKTGKASFYADKFHGRTTASGEIYDRACFTAAHRTLPFGTMVKVTNRYNGQSVVVRINDRGPHAQDRIIDLSYIAAKKLDMIKKGIIPVTIEIVTSPPKHHVR